MPDKSKGYWGAYGLAKAIWLGEPDFRKEMIGRSELSWNNREEIQAIGFMLGNYVDGREKGEYKLDLDMERLKTIALEGYINEFVFYEMGSRIDPYIALQIPEAQRLRLHEYVTRYVLMAKEK